MYFLLPNLESAKRVEADLLLARVEDRRMHFLAKRGIDLGELPEATVAQKTDLVHGLQIGLFTGMGIGVVVGLATFFALGATSLTSLGIVLLLVLLGGAFGVFAAGLIASSAPNTRLKEFDEPLNAGQILLMVDVPKERLEEISQIIRKTHPEAEDHGIEPTIPAFP